MDNILSQKVVLASLHLTQLPRKVQDVNATEMVRAKTGASIDSGIFIKTLFTRDMLSPITAPCSRARTLHGKMTHPFTRGVGMLANGLISEYQTGMKLIQIEQQKGIDGVCRRLPDLIEKRMKDLQGLGDRSEFPTEDEVRRRLTFEWKIFPFPEVGGFHQDLIGDAADELRDEFDKQIKDRLDYADKLVQKRLFAALSDAADRLGAEVEDGKKGPHYRVMFDKLEESFRHLRALNLAGDPDIADVIDQAEDKILKYDAKDVREVKPLREQCAKEAQSLVDQMATVFAL